MEKLLVLIHITFNNLYEKLLNYERLVLTRFYFQTESLHARLFGEKEETRPPSYFGGKKALGASQRKISLFVVHNAFLFAGQQSCVHFFFFPNLIIKLISLGVTLIMMMTTSV